MPMIQADDGVRLYAESTGSGTPMLFIHEFAGDHRSWEPQVRAPGPSSPPRSASTPRPGPR
jgi:pimeloyl-ACP methyl ester carboxylesterase